MDTTATARRRGTQDGSAGNQQYETIVIGVLVMQLCLAWIRAIRANPENRTVP